jgi:tetratricopeptide (TPR) repeat protein
MTQVDASAPGREDGTALRRAAALIKARRYDEAKGLLEKELIRLPTDPQLHYLLGMAAYRSGDNAAALAAFQRAVDTDPANASALYGLGLTLRHRGEYGEARSAFEGALAANPKLEEARAQLANLPAERSPVYGFSAPPRAAPAGVKPDEPTVDPEATVSLAELLDTRGRPQPDDDTLAGEVVWEGQPSPRMLVGAGIGAILLLLVPGLLEDAASGLPSGPARDALAWLWRVAYAAALPAALFLVVLSAANWMTRFYVLRRHRIEVSSGLLRRQHVTVWLHDLERPIAVNQKLWHLALGVATIRLDTTILPAGRGRRAAGRPGRLLLSGLPNDLAEELSAVIRAEALWQRRRMVQNFVSSR